MLSQSDDTLTAALRRRLALLSACTLGGLLAGGIYLGITPRRVVAVSKVMIERIAPSSINLSGGDAFIDAQTDVMRSREVLRLAEARGQLGSLQTFKGIRDPVPAIQKSLGVKVGQSASGNVLTVTFPAHTESDAVEVVESIVNAYRTYQSDQKQQKSQELSVAIAADRKAIEDQLAQAKKALAEYDQATGGAGLETPGQRITSVSDALTNAELDTISAKRVYDESINLAGSALTDLTDEQLENTLREANVSAPESPELIEQEARALEVQLAELRTTYSQNHPSVVRASQRLNQVRLTQVAAMRARWRSAQSREADLRKTFSQIQKDTSLQTARQGERTKLADEVKRLQVRADELASRLNEITLMTTAGSLNVSVLTPAEANNPDYPSLPRMMPTLLTSALIGLGLGGLLSIAGELRGSRSLRSPVPGRSATPLLGRPGESSGLKSLGSIPDVEASPEDGALALAAQNDPFGAFSNAVRSVRAACEVDGALPASMILTSAMSGEGKSTLATNLASIIAREGRKVLLVDLNFNQPALHTILGVDGSSGLSELLTGGDAVALIRQTAITRLDLLPAGARPADSALLLNGEQLPQSLSMLTSAYDHVIFDGNALAFGDDARIVSSLTDATILVSKDSASSLRRAAGARDMLLMVGANLLGVVLTRSRASTPLRVSQDD